MKKYKLIKCYPGSPCFGAEIIEAADIKGRYFIKRNDIWFINNPEKYSEWWQEVIEKDYEILSWINPSGRLESIAHSIFDELHTKIHSIKRLSDGEVFTIGDKTINNEIINELELINSKLKVWSVHPIYSCPIKPKDNSSITGCGNMNFNWLKDIKKAKQALFTTEDGVDIFEGNICFTVSLNDYKLHNNNGWKVSKDSIYQLYQYQLTSFSTKEKAEEYILMNKKSLSPNDILKVWSDLSGHTTKSLLTNSKLMHCILTSIK